MTYQKVMLDSSFVKRKVQKCKRFMIHFHDTILFQVTDCGIKGCVVPKMFVISWDFTYSVGWHSGWAVAL